MTDQQNDFQTALRLAGIELPESQIPLIYELAKACEKHKEIDLRQWAKVFAEHAPVELKKAVAKRGAAPQPQQPRNHQPLNIANGVHEYPKAC